MEIRKIRVETIQENSWNPNRVGDEVMESLVRSIEERGYVQPIIVREKGGVYEVIDGAHRLRALKELGYEEADCVVVADGEKDARMRTLVMNRLRGKFDNEALAGVLSEIGESDEFYEKTLAYSGDELEEIKSLLEPPPLLDALGQTEDDGFFVEFYLKKEEAELVENAVSKASENNRSEGIVKICKEYLGESLN